MPKSGSLTDIWFWPFAVYTALYPWEFDIKKTAKSSIILYAAVPQSSGQGIDRAFHGNPMGSQRAWLGRRPNDNDL